MFLKSKPIAQQAEEKRAKLEMKRIEVQSENLDVAKIAARRQKQMELRRLTA